MANLKVSAGTLSKYKNMAEALRQRVARVREKGEKTLETAAEAAVTSVTAFGLGIVQGKTGGLAPFGVPLDLLVGIGGHVAGFMGVGGKRSEHLHSVGNGGLATYAATMGRSVGLNWAKTGKLTGGAAAPAQIPAGAAQGLDGLSDKELAESVLRR